MSAHFYYNFPKVCFELCQKASDASFQITMLLVVVCFKAMSWVHQQLEETHNAGLNFPNQRTKILMKEHAGPQDH